MSERYRQNPENKPADVKLVEGGKKLKVLEGGAGLVIGFFNPVIGSITLAGAAFGWFVGDRYVDMRMKSRQRTMQDKSNVIQFPQKGYRQIPQAA